MISINATLILQVLHFLILVWILNRLLFRPILHLMDDRDQHIAQIKGKAESLENETQALVDKCAAMEKEARINARKERVKLEQEAFSQSEHIFQDTRAEIEKIRSEAEKEIDRQVEKAKDVLRSEAVIIADEIIEKVIGRRVEA